MVDKVEITDPYRVDPTLRDKSAKQLEHEITLRQMALEERKREERKKELEALVNKLNAAQDTFLDAMRILDDNGLLPDAVKSAYTTVGGVFAPHLRHRAIDADRLLTRQEKADKPKRPRVPRKPKG